MLIAAMDIEDWRKQIDELDRRLVELLNQRAQCAVEIGRLKRNTNLPVYEPDRERMILENVCRVNRGPLSDSDLKQVYERLIDVMRTIQKLDMKPQVKVVGEGTEFDLDVND
ncbi:MAG TPA: chorismate mutase [Terriglobales bacterium]|nr:chorismate mutase [Terriglobales bacterium]